MDKPIRRKQATVKGGRRHVFNVRLEPGLFYRLEGLAQARGISVAALLAAGAKNELAKVNGVENAQPVQV